MKTNFCFIAAVALICLLSSTASGKILIKKAGTIPGGNKTSGVEVVSYSPDGKYLSVTRWDDTTLYQRKDMKPLVVLRAKDSEIEYYDDIPPEKEHFYSSKYSLHEFNAFSGNSKYLVARNAFALILYDIEKNRLREICPEDGFIYSSRLSSDSKYLVVALGGFALESTPIGLIPVPSTMGKVQIVDIEKWKVIKTIIDRNMIFWTETIYFADISPDNRYIITVSEKGYPKILDIQDKNREIAKIKHENVKEALFSKNGRYVLTRSSNFTKIFDIKTKTIIASISHGDFHTTAAMRDISRFSENSKYVLVNSPKKVIIFSIEENKIIREISHPSEEITHSKFSPDSRFVAVGTEKDDLALLYDLNTNELVSIEPHARGSWVHHVAFSPDSKELILSQWDATIFKLEY